ncbi:MAG: aminodeoxychorismate synthase component I [Acidimicrobiales bacterium]
MANPQVPSSGADRSGFVARFDDCHEPGSSFELTEPIAELSAKWLGDVERVLGEVEAAARAGHWVAGFVAYEAAPAFDPALRVVTSGRRGVPFVRFVVFRSRVPPAPLGPLAKDLGKEPSDGWRPQLSPAEHARGVASIRDRIRSGVTYQVNLTTQLSGQVPDPVQLYARMLAAQRCRYGALLTGGTHAVISASPELFFEVCGERIVTRPMKGTSRRGRWDDEDVRAATQLATSEKDRSENVMVVDMIRSDLGRISRTGSVEVSDLFAVEPYPTVWQLTSTVSSRLRPRTRLRDVFRALFPSGSVTGAPKVTAMTAISELERTPRGVYCGAIGYLAPGPELRARFSVGIRTVVVDETTGGAVYGSGGGITWLSNAASEWTELLDKTRVISPDAAPTGLIETMRTRSDGSVRNLEYHLARLRRSAQMLGIPLDERALAEALAVHRDAGRIRLCLDSTGKVTGERSSLPASAFGPVRLGIIDHAVSSKDHTLFHKVADRSRYDRWRAQRPDADDVILVNERGEATETTIANLVVKLDGRWWTPPLDCGLLPGVERGRLLDVGELAERVIPVSELSRASLGVISSLRGWRSAVLAEPPRPPCPEALRWDLENFD